MGKALNDAYTAVFGPQDTGVTVPQDAADPAAYTAENTPGDVCLTQQVLGFAYANPLTGPVTDRFGYRQDPNGGGQQFHYGLDIAAIKAGRSVSLKPFEDFRDAAAEDGVDYMIFDCPPGFSTGSVAALNAAEGVVVTTKVDGFSLRGVAKLRAQLRSMRTAGSDAIDGVLITQWRKDNAVLTGEQVLRSARGLKVFDTVIRWSSPVDGSTMAQQPLDEYSPRSNAAQDYRAWVKEYLGEEVQA